MSSAMEIAKEILLRQDGNAKYYPEEVVPLAEEVIRLTEENEKLRAGDYQSEYLSQRSRLDEQAVAIREAERIITDAAYDENYEAQYALEWLAKWVEKK